MATPLFKAESRAKQCSVIGCERGARNLGVCGKHYQRMRAHGSYVLPARPERQWAFCSIEGCDKPSRTVAGLLCEMHYGRRRRNGNFNAPVWGKWSVTGHGYVMRYDPPHPAASRGGYVYQHRAVLLDAIGPGEHPCHWCGSTIEWGAKGKRKLVVDHLDGNKQHNARSNLVASCHRCNASRGLFQWWVMQHRDDPFLWSLYEQARAA